MSKALSAAPALIVSLIALGISVRTYVYNRNKDNRARKQSIQDDFWLRKVVSPVSIEPFLEYINDLCATLPFRVTEDEAKTFWLAQVAELGKFEVAFQTLALIDRQLMADVLKQFEFLNDRLSDYIGEVRLFIDSPTAPTPDRDGTVRVILSVSMKLLSLIKDHQTKVWSDN